ncbi:hypothetical protein NIE88_10750 [Sporolactobacillus shoreicorticis]|uniref:Uncharacterized protein n=1 Tax=Sporolactobacillus shoreicorticis TaxID=1923877 RepID=A0ABW5S5S0_9BACL|nr:hypothetical protein [Sporolactobacillus shoreicorticis]MCO7126253.1 hypothetical protein [Sporolactobacillus shoreicorticis]
MILPLQSADQQVFGHLPFHYTKELTIIINGELFPTGLLFIQQPDAQNSNKKENRRSGHVYGLYISHSVGSRSRPAVRYTVLIGF